MYDKPNVTSPDPMSRRFGPVYSSRVSPAGGATTGAATKGVATTGVGAGAGGSTTVVSADDERAYASAAAAGRPLEEKASSGLSTEDRADRVLLRPFGFPLTSPPHSLKIVVAAGYVTGIVGAPCTAHLVIVALDGG
jgi:hypothetical protein